jgi:hypothetical protein
MLEIFYIVSTPQSPDPRAIATRGRVTLRAAPGAATSAGGDRLAQRRQECKHLAYERCSTRWSLGSTVPDGAALVGLAAMTASDDRCILRTQRIDSGHATSC